MSIMMLLAGVFVFFLIGFVYASLNFYFGWSHRSRWDQDYDSRGDFPLLLVIAWPWTLFIELVCKLWSWILVGVERVWFFGRSVCDGYWGWLKSKREQRLLVDLGREKDKLSILAELGIRRGWTISDGDES
jgi:hypothetical protein